MDATCIVQWTGFSCCANLKLFIYRHALTAFVRYDPCLDTITMGIDTWTKRFKMNHIDDFSTYGRIALGVGVVLYGWRVVEFAQRRHWRFSRCIPGKNGTKFMIITELYNYWRKHWSAELHGAAVTCYMPTGRCHDECDTMLCSKFRLQIKTGPNHCNLVIFFSFSRNLEHCRVPHSSWRRPK